MEICPKCGLPEQACVCEQIGKDSQRIQVATEKRRYGKVITMVTGLDKDVDIKKIAKALKNELACGGTFKGGVIELMGDHLKKVKPILVELGFDQDAIQD